MIKNKTLSIITSMALTLSSLFIAGSTSYADTSVVPDEGLKVVINRNRSRAEDTPISKKDIEFMSRIDSSINNPDKGYMQQGNGIKSIEGLQYCKSLEHLNLPYNRIEDLSPLSNITTLKDVSLSNNKIKSLSPISNSKDLYFLNVMSNNITDISPLKGMDKMRYLYLASNDIGDLSSLIGMNELERLILAGNKTKLDYNMKSQISQLTTLKDLYLPEMVDDDISFLSTLTELEELDFFIDDKISDLSVFKNLKNLKKLSITFDESVEDISPLLELTNLEELVIWKKVNIKNFNELSNLKKLKKIRMAGKDIDLSKGIIDATYQDEIYDVTDEFLEKSSNLEKLAIYIGNKRPLNNIDNLSKLKNLKTLSLVATNITKENIRNLIANLPNLETLLFSPGEEFIDIGDIQEIKNSKLKNISQSLSGYEHIYTDTIDNKFIFNGQYIKVLKNAQIAGGGGVTTIDNSDISKIKIVDYDSLIKEKESRSIVVYYEFTDNNIKYYGKRYLYLSEKGTNPQKPYSIQILNGKSSKTKGYKGEKIEITANQASSGQIFDRWISQDVNLDDSYSETTSFIMPNKNVLIEALYKNYNPIQTIKTTTDTILMTQTTTQVQLEITPSDYTDNIKWSSSNENVATVKNAIVTAKSNGETIITATTSTGKQAKVKIIVQGFAKDNTGGSSSSGGSSSGSGSSSGGGSSSRKIKKENVNKKENVSKKEELNKTVEKEDVTKIFTDIKKDSWYTKYIQYVVDNDIMKGISKNEFSPNSSVNRYMLVTTLYNLSGKPVVDSQNSFTDVEENQWYTSSISWAIKQNIVKGYEDGTFKGKNDITREQMVVMIYNHARTKNTNIKSNISILDDYSDAMNISSYAKDAMAWAIENGIISGVGQKTLSPKTGATRAQLAVILQKYLELNK